MSPSHSKENKSKQYPKLDERNGSSSKHYEKLGSEDDLSGGRGSNGDKGKDNKAGNDGSKCTVLVKGLALNAGAYKSEPRKRVDPKKGMFWSETFNFQ